MATRAETDAATASGLARPRPTDSARSVLLTILGELVLPAGGDVWAGTLVDGLAVLGYGDRNARQAMTRLRDDGVIAPERHGRRTRWGLTADGEHLLRVGAERIYRFGQRDEPWDGRWLVVVCQIPETQREKRRRLQTQLSFAGFGFPTSTIAVSPHAGAEDTANEVLARLDLADSALVLLAETGARTPDGRLLERSWDLEALGRSYEAFVETFGDVRPESPEASFRELVRLVHAWRHFPFADPELPPQLLPPGWVGNVARHLFTDARASWSVDAAAHVKELEATHEG